MTIAAAAIVIGIIAAINNGARALGDLEREHQGSTW